MYQFSQSVILQVKRVIILRTLTPSFQGSNPCSPANETSAVRTAEVIFLPGEAQQPVVTDRKFRISLP